MGCLDAFGRFLRLLAGRIGRLFEADSLAGDVGVSPVAIRRGLSVLETSCIVFPLRPDYRNFGK